MKILVLGATGMLGSSLVPALLKFGHEVVSHGRSGVAEMVGDLDDLNEAMRVIAAASADVVVNLVALTEVDRCEEKPQEAWRLNVRTAQNISAACQNCSSHLIHISTDQVYYGLGPHIEEAALPGNYYAQTKYAGELAVLSFGATVLRTNFIGISRQANRRSFTDWLFDALLENRTVPVFSDVLFSPLCTKTLCYLIEKLVHLRPSGVFNLGAREGMSKADFAMYFALALGFTTTNLAPTSLDKLALKAWRPKDMRMNCDRIETILGGPLPLLAEEIILAAKDYHAST